MFELSLWKFELQPVFNFFCHVNHSWCLLCSTPPVAVRRRSVQVPHHLPHTVSVACIFYLFFFFFFTDGFKVILTVAQLQEVFSHRGRWLEAPLWVILTGILWKMLCVCVYVCVRVCVCVCVCIFVCLPVSEGFRQRASCSWPKREIIKLIELLKRDKRCDSSIVLPLIVPVGSFRAQVVLPLSCAAYYPHCVLHSAASTGWSMFVSFHPISVIVDGPAAWL